MEIKDIKVSIITPVYNMEVLLPKCIESILGQTHSNIELILVDDGSIDNSGRICDEYAQKDSRVRAIHQKNGGIACAINTGLDAIKGDFLLFIDSDDYIAPIMVERLLGLMIEHDADVVQCDTYSFRSADGVDIIPQPQGKLFFYNTRDEILDDFFHYRRIKRNLAARLFKTSLFAGIRCEPGRMIIDSVTLPRLLVKCNKYIFVDEKYYYVYARSTSVSRRPYTLEQWEDCKYGNQFMEKFVKDNCHEFIDFVYYRYIYTNMKAYLWMYKNKTEQGRISVMNESLSIFRKYLPIFKHTDRYKEQNLGYKIALELFANTPNVYRTYWIVKSSLISSLSKLKHQIFNNG